MNLKHPDQTISFSLLLFLMIMIFSFSPFVTCQTIPTLVPENSLLLGQSNYIMNYFAYRSFLSSSYFQIDFSQSQISVPDGVLNISATINSNHVTSSNLMANCTNKVCVLRLGAGFSSGANLVVNFGLLRNPKYTSSQRINILIYYSVNINQTQTISISSSVYIPMPVIVNSVSQTDYGVGSQQVDYTFNISLNYIPPNPQLSIQIPIEVGYDSISTQLLFYGNKMNVSPFLTSNMIIIQLSTAQMMNPVGFMLLKLSGFRNPLFIGSSSSFNITIVQKRILTTNNCVTCRVAYLYPNNTHLLKVNSTTPGDIKMNLFSSTNTTVNEKTNLTIGIKIVAPIPQGGKFRVILPTGIQPSLPIYCQAIYGFTLTSNAYCMYNTSTRSIQTVNYSVPYLQQSGDIIIRITVINPIDNRNNLLSFQTIDDQNRKIGKSKIPFSYQAIPLNLNVIVSKNNTEIDSVYTLSGVITLGRVLSISKDRILLIIPSSDTSINTSTIQCTSNSQLLTCSTSFQPYTNNLLISFPPPCTTCEISSTISFKISNLINPSFISDENNNIEIQTLSDYNATVQVYNGEIGLKQKQMIITNYTWIGENKIGGDMIINLQYEIPSYVKKYGGYVNLLFEKYVLYVNLIINNNNNGVSYPSTVNISNQLNVPLINTVQYYNQVIPLSIKSIKIKICTSDSPCSSKLSISTVRRPLTVLPFSFQLIYGTTLFNQNISYSSIDLSLLLPKVNQAVLQLNVTNSVTNSLTNYMMKFKMDKVVFSSGLMVKLSGKHVMTSDSRCFVDVTPGNVLGYGIDCNIVNNSMLVNNNSMLVNNNSMIQLTYTGDCTLMLLSSITYTITIINVLNPPSLLPYLYKIQTQYNNITNNIFTTSYSFSSAQPLSYDSLQSSNRTYGQNSTVTIKLLNDYYQLFDQIKIYVNKVQYSKLYAYNNVTLSSNLMNNNMSYQYNQNGSHYIFDKIYSLTNNLITFNIMNSQSTIANGNITIQMYMQGYLSSKGVFKLPSIEPINLIYDVASINRYVGEITQLKINVTRVVQITKQKYLKILINQTVIQANTNKLQLTLQSTNSLYGNIYSFKQPISSLTWLNKSTLITISQLVNLFYIPNNISILLLPSIQIMTLDQNNITIGLCHINMSRIVPNMIKSPEKLVTGRNIIQSNDFTNLSISFISKYVNKLNRIKIDLPVGENKLTQTFMCYIVYNTTNINNTCKIISKNQSSIIIQSINLTSSTQIKLYFINILNLYRTSNNLSVSLLTLNNQFIQSGSIKILPQIQYDPISLSIISNTSNVGQNSKIEFIIKSMENQIVKGYKLKVQLPYKIYTKITAINNKQCEYEILNVKYYNCQYILSNTTNNNNNTNINNINNNNYEYIQAIIVPFLTSTSLGINNIIKLTLYLTNPFTSYQFESRSISIITLTSQNQQDSRGSYSLTALYNNEKQFKLVNINKYNITESNVNCNQENIIKIDIEVPIMIVKDTYLYVNVPQGIYDVITTNTSDITFTQIPLSNIIQIRQKLSCTLTTSNQLCISANQKLSYSFKLKNDKYISSSSNKRLSFYLSNDNYNITNLIQYNIKDRVAVSFNNVTIQKTNQNINQQTNLSIIILTTDLINIMNIISSNEILYVRIQPVNTIISILENITNTNTSNNNNTNTNNNMINNVIKNNSNIIIELNKSSILNNTTTTTKLSLCGYNPLYSPNNNNQSYNIKLYSSLYTYYSSLYIMTVQDKLLPFSSNISIQRSSSLVSYKSNYTLSGTLLYNTLINPRIIYNNNITVYINNVIYLPLIKLGEYTNPMSINSNIKENVKISNQTHILYENKNINILPELEGIPLSNTFVNYIQYNKEMRINTEEILKINIDNPITYFSSLNLFTNIPSQSIIIKLPRFYKQIKQITINNKSTLYETYLSLQSDNRSLIKLSYSSIQQLLPSSNTLNNLSSNTLNNLTILIRFITPQYQLSPLSYQTISIQLQSPTYSISYPFPISVYGTEIKTNLKLLSNKVNVVNNIILQIVPIQKNSVMRVYLPQYINDKIEQIINDNDQNSINNYIKLNINQINKSIKQTQLLLTNNNNTINNNTINNNNNNNNNKVYYLQFSISTNISNMINSLQLSFISFINPITNEPYYFIIQQHQLISSASNLLIFGHSSQIIQMSELQRIRIYSTQRNTSKIGQDIQIKIKFQLIDTSNVNYKEYLLSNIKQNCIISMPQVQVTRIINGQCKVYNQLTNAYIQSCRLHSSIPNAIITSCSIGINYLNIKMAYSNILYSITPLSNNKPQIFIGYPYRYATSILLQTPYLLPLVTAGNMLLTNLKSTSKIKLESTILSFRLILENIKQVNSVMIIFDKYHYLIDQNQLKCKVNDKIEQCWKIKDNNNNNNSNNNSNINNSNIIMINSNNINNTNVNIQIYGLINFVKQSNFTVKTMKYLRNNQNNNNIVSSSISNQIPIVKQSLLSDFAMIDFFYSQSIDPTLQLLSNNYYSRMIITQSYVSNNIQQILIIFDDDYKLPAILNRENLYFNLQSNYNNCTIINSKYQISTVMKCLFDKSKMLQMTVSLFYSQYDQYELSYVKLSKFISPVLKLKCENQMCDKCSTNSNGQQNCFNCRQNYYEYMNNCVQSCPIGYTQYQQSKSCEQCSQNCIDCYNILPNNCLKCKQNLLSSNGQCKNKCPVGQYVYNNYCVSQNQCYNSGCRYCSMIGFCYQCLPEYTGQPNCKWQPLLPSLFMTFFVLPFVIYAIVSSIVIGFRKSIKIMSYQLLFSFSVLEFMIWIFIIPNLHTKQQALFMVTMIILRIILSIVSYQTYYKKTINSHIGLSQQQSLLKQGNNNQKASQIQKSHKKSQNNSQSNPITNSNTSFQQDYKSKTLRFLAHLIGPDIYEQFKVVYDNKIRIVHNNIYLWIMFVNRFLVLVFSFYLFVQMFNGDLLYMPILNIICAIVLYGVRLIKNQKVVKLINICKLK